MKTFIITFKVEGLVVKQEFIAIDSWNAQQIFWEVVDLSEWKRDDVTFISVTEKGAK